MSHHKVFPGLNQNSKWPRYFVAVVVMVLPVEEEFIIVVTALLFDDPAAAAAATDWTIFFDAIMLAFNLQLNSTQLNSTAAY